MKKQMALALGLAVISGSALASKARLEALGEDSNGSQYIMDARNIFLNPAQANYFKDMVTFEAGDASNPANTSDADIDEAGATNAEGGFLRASGNMVYGVFFGHVDATIAGARRDAFSTDAQRGAVEDQNVWDFFLAGDAGVQWGVNLTYQSATDEQTDFGGSADNDEASVDSIRANLGVISGDTEVFLKTTISESAEVDGIAEFNMKSYYALGASHNWRGGTWMVNYTAWDAEEKESGAENYKGTAIRVGWGKVSKLNDSANFNYAINYTNLDLEGVGYTDTEAKGTAVSATMGIEASVKEWLTLRGSISQNIHNEVEDDAGDKTTGDDSTTVTAGASLIWGDFQIDGMIGNTNGTTVGEDTSAGNGTLRTDALLSRVSATYRF